MSVEVIRLYVEEQCPLGANGGMGWTVDDYIRFVLQLQPSQPLIAEDYDHFFREWIVRNDNHKRFFEVYYAPRLITTTTAAKPKNQPPPLPLSLPPSRNEPSPVVKVPSPLPVSISVPVAIPIPKLGTLKIRRPKTFPQTDPTALLWIDCAHPHGFPKGYQTTVNYQPKHVPRSFLVQKDVWELFLQCQLITFPKKGNPFPVFNTIPREVFKYKASSPKDTHRTLDTEVNPEFVCYTIDQTPRSRTGLEEKIQQLSL